MAFSTLYYWSPALGKQVMANVILPEGQGAGPFSVLYLLHGRSDDHSIWARRTRIECYVANLPLIVVMPDGARGFYCDGVNAPAYQTAIAIDLVDFIDATFHTKAERSGRFLSGNSMGGYGAVKLALQYPDRFASAHGLSSACCFGHNQNLTSPEMSAIYGDAANGGGPNDLYVLTEKAAPGQWPRIRLCCGVDDFLIEDNREFHRHLESLGRVHEYEEFPGAHDWDYWDLHIRDSLKFHA
jgi:S-formylglutathione hydrolase FrmB